MKSASTIGKKGLYIGAAAGLLLFALFGLLPSVFMGGVIGIKIATYLFGAPLGIALLPRVVVGMSMVLGILVAGMVFTVGSALVCWIFGHVADTVRAARTSHMTPTGNKA